VELDPSNIGARFSLAEVYADEERYADAVRIYQGLVEEADSPLRALEMTDEAVADAYAGLAQTYNDAGQYQEALETAQQFLMRFPDDPAGLYQLATAYDELGRRDEAIETYERALEADPLNADVMNDLADTYLEVGRVNDAIDSATTAVAVDPSLGLAWETLAQALRAAGREEEAVRAEQRAREIES